MMIVGGVTIAIVGGISWLYWHYKKDEEKLTLGCKHYNRACLMECPDYQRCGKRSFYPCRLCHDTIHFEQQLDPKKNHQLDRHSVTQIKCLRCTQQQNPGPTCISCK